MSKAKHTPGPWESINGYIFPIKGEKICIMTAMGSKGSEREANARLIAAAPELLEALQSIIEIGKRNTENPKYDGYYDAARAAIAKATGETENIPEQ